MSDSESIFILTDNKLITLIGESIFILIDLRSFFPIRVETLKLRYRILRERQRIQNFPLARSNESEKSESEISSFLSLGKREICTRASRFSISHANSLGNLDASSGEIARFLKNSELVSISRKNILYACRHTLNKYTRRSKSFVNPNPLLFRTIPTRVYAYSENAVGNFD